MNDPSHCDLCGLPRRSNRFSHTCQDRTYRFCCIGCKQVFRMISEAADGDNPASFQDTELFRRCRALGLVPSSEEQMPSEPRAGGAPGSAPDLSVAMRVKDMWCPACAWFIEAALMKFPGVARARCDFSTDRLRVNYDPVVTSPASVAEQVERLGYRAFLDDGPMAGSSVDPMFVRLMVSLFLTANIMMLSYSVYAGFFRDLPGAAIGRMTWPAFTMATLVVFYGGWPIFKSAVVRMPSLSMGMESLVTAGVFCAYGYSIYSMLHQSPHVYFDTAAMLVTLVLLGKTIESGAKQRITRALAQLMSAMPAKVRLITESSSGRREAYADVKALQRGMVFCVEEGEIVPADGVVTSGTGRTDEAVLTGEARPVAKREGDSVRSGTRILEGRLLARAVAVGDAAIMGRMIRIMEQAIGQKTDAEERTDIFLQWFVPAILFIALVTGLTCYLSGLTVDKSLIRAVTVMVIACPCALGIAMPLIRVAAVSRCGKKGILVRNFSSFERAGHVDTFVFDKTGTLTSGRWVLQHILPLNGFTEEFILQTAVSLEKDSGHDIAAALKEKARDDGLTSVPVYALQEHENGVSGSTRDGVFRIGSKTFAGGDIDAEGSLRRFYGRGEDALYSVVYMTRNNAPCGLFVFGDRLNGQSSDVVSALKRSGHDVWIVSGDGTGVTEKAGQCLDVTNVRGGMSPIDKASLIEALQKRGRVVAMVGDGLNDAPAMARADLSIGVCAGRYLGKDAADVTLMDERLEKIVYYVNFARLVRWKMRQNLGFSVFYNAVAVPIAVAGLLTPVVAVLAMLMSSLTVVGNAWMMGQKEPFSGRWFRGGMPALPDWDHANASAGKGGTS